MRSSVYYVRPERMLSYIQVSFSLFLSHTLALSLSLSLSLFLSFSLSLFLSLSLSLTLSHTHTHKYLLILLARRSWFVQGKVLIWKRNRFVSWGNSKLPNIFQCVGDGTLSVATKFLIAELRGHYGTVQIFLVTLIINVTIVIKWHC